ncbi:phosphohistidine phosphatase SixA [Enterobacteriaceae bacterium ESL0689]|nr:phosphohistidine phosphatase SixA [Enterobacteriaceae bacterium ESL0689]
MQVFIMRHGDAVLHAASDAARPLTSLGCEQSRQMAAWLQAQDVVIERVLVSPYLRAQQTMDNVSKGIELPDDIAIMPELVPGGNARRVGDELQELAYEGVASVLVISHLPLVGDLVAELCPHEFSPRFTPSTIACVTIDDQGNGRFNWQMSPDKLSHAR